MEDFIKIPTYVLEDVKNTLRQVANAMEAYSRDTCLKRDIICNLIEVTKILNGEELTGMERFEKL